MDFITFFKYQGTGNDFILIDGREEIPSWSQAKIAKLCHRRFGIGADGLIILTKDPHHDFRMVYYNSDGRESSMCGNGGRCIARFAHDLGLGDRFNFLAIDGPHQAEILYDEVRLQMGNVKEITAEGKDWFTDTGSPHHVQFHPNPDSLDIVPTARAIRNKAPYAEDGVNVNFISGKGQNWEMRTYERGVEDETYSCGTGVTAAGLVAHHTGKAQSPIRMKTKGGILSLAFDYNPSKGYYNIWLQGPAQRVFEGQLND